MARACLLLGAATHAAVPRFHLCEDAPPQALHLAQGTLRVFSASLARRWNSVPTLRAALLWEDSRGWTAHLAELDRTVPDSPFDAAVESISYADAQRRTGISREVFDSEEERRRLLGRYAKCFGRRVPALAMGLRLAGNTTRPCSLLRYENGELQHDFAHCAAGRVDLWRRVPGRLRAELQVESGSVALELCLVEAPLRSLSICTMPLYGYRALSRERPWALEDWLTYHLDLIGVDSVELYDIDGSFSEAARSNRSRLARLAYHGRWPESLSPAMARLSERIPGCSETWAYAHCLTKHRATSRWVAIVHSFDEFLVPGHAEQPGALQRALRVVEQQRPPDDWLPYARVKALSFAAGPAGPAGPARTRGSVFASTLRGREHYVFTPLLDPAACACAGPHACYRPVVANSYGGPMVEVPTSVLQMFHYVELLDRDRGRCSRIPANGPCDVEDHSMAWALRRLAAWPGSAHAPLESRQGIHGFQ